MIDCQGIMATLSSRRPVFHSEADFQHEFAIALREGMSDCRVRLEQPFGFEKGGATDIVVMRQGTTFGIELKYLTKRLVWESADEIFQLKAHGATDLRRYDVLKDVERLEAFNARHGGKSYVIALTNEPAYWRKTSKEATIDASFRLCEGRIATGLLAWAEHAGAGSVRGRERPINLHNEYIIRWRDYCTLLDATVDFKYLCLEIS